MYIIVLLLSVAAYYGIVRRESSRVQSGTYGNCHRTNIQRATANANDYNNYKVFRTVEVLSAVPSTGITTSQQRAAGKLFLKGLVQATNSEKWIPLTNCRQALDNPYHYVPPDPITFYNRRELPPPYTAFHLGPEN